VRVVSRAIGWRTSRFSLERLTQLLRQFSEEAKQKRKTRSLFQSGTGSQHTYWLLAALYLKTVKKKDRSSQIEQPITLPFLRHRQFPSTIWLSKHKKSTQSPERRFGLTMVMSQILNLGPRNRVLDQTPKLLILVITRILQYSDRTLIRFSIFVSNAL
jgi:hypothetical protein